MTHWLLHGTDLVMRGVVAMHEHHMGGQVAVVLNDERSVCDVFTPNGRPNARRLSMRVGAGVQGAFDDSLIKRLQAL